LCSDDLSIIHDHKIIAGETGNLTPSGVGISALFCGQNPTIFLAEVKTMWDDYDPNAGSDLLIAKNTADSVFESCKILEVGETEARSGTKWPWLLVQDKTTAKVFRFAAWARDIKPLLEQFGTNPNNFEGQEIKIEVRNGTLEVTPLSDFKVEDVVDLEVARQGRQGSGGGLTPTPNQ